MIWLSGMIGGLGLICLVWQRTLLGIMIGIQLLILGATMIFVLAGISAGDRLEGHVVALFVTLGGIAQLVAGFALAVRMFYLRNKTEMSELRSLRQ